MSESQLALSDDVGSGRIAAATETEVEAEEPLRLLGEVRRRDFTVRPFAVSSDAIGFLQVLNTLGPYALLWFLAYRLAPMSHWLLVPVAALLILFSLRSFALMHDCGHYTLFRSVAINRCVGFVLGAIHGIPQYPWSRGHAFHHKHNGNWEVYRGPIGILSTEQFGRLSPRRQRLHVRLRHPLMLLPAGFVYLIVKPRVQLLLGSILFLPHLASCLRQGRIRDVPAYRSKCWYTTGEFWHMLFTNALVIGMWVVMGRIFGHAVFWTLLSVVASCSAAIFLLVFFVQHQFEGTYASDSRNWDPLAGALAGTSLLRFPRWLTWFTADIGYHNIHHLCDRIPNYRLAACHRANAPLLAGVRSLHLRDIPGCLAYILWDPRRQRLQSAAQYFQEMSSAVTA